MEMAPFINDWPMTVCRISFRVALRKKVSRAVCGEIPDNMEHRIEIACELKTCLFRTTIRRAQTKR